MSTLKLKKIKALSNPLEIEGNVIVSGTVTANAFYGDGSNLTQSINEIRLTGDRASNTSTYLNYGINLINTGSSINYAARLPMTPVKGKTVTVINNSGISMVLYPSMDGGSINGVLNGSAVIPSDNRAYSFTCYENPAPGSWSGAFLAATNQYDSGEISADNSLGSLGWVSASDPMRWVESSAINSNTGWAFDGLNNPYYQIIPQTGNYSGSVAFKPQTPWSFITKITVYTNITAGGSQTFGLAHGAFYNFYTPGSTLSADLLDSQFGASGNFGTPAYGYLQNVVAGTPTTVSGTGYYATSITGANGTFTQHCGEPGTKWGELIYTSQPFEIGDRFLGTSNWPLGQFSIPTLSDKWSTRYINFAFQPRGNTVGLKFRFIIDYIP